MIDLTDPPRIRLLRAGALTGGRLAARPGGFGAGARVGRLPGVASILAVCTGNICRSPMAEGFLRGMLAVRGVEGVRVARAA